MMITVRYQCSILVHEKVRSVVRYFYLCTCIDRRSCAGDGVLVHSDGLYPYVLIGKNDRKM